MTLEEVSKMPYNEKKSVVSEACIFYRKLKATSNFIKNKGWEISDAVRSKNLLNIRGTSMFEVILNLLSKQHFEIIDKEFINFEVYPNNWYEEFYSKSTFYRLKHEAIDHFIFLLFQ